MSQRRSIADEQAHYDAMDRRDPRALHQVLSPSDAGILLFRTSTQGCLTHITRWVVDRVATWDGGQLHRSARAECGVSGSLWWGTLPMIVVDPADETFGCHQCIARAEQFGLPTYGLFPDTGCAATGGARFKPRKPRQDS